VGSNPLGVATNQGLGARRHWLPQAERGEEGGFWFWRSLSGFGTPRVRDELGHFFEDHRLASDAILWLFFLDLGALCTEKDVFQRLSELLRPG